MVEIGLLAMVSLPVAIAGRLWRTQVNEQSEEEEQLTGDENLDPMGSGGQLKGRDPRLSGWEYKIVRAGRKVFRDPAVFSKLCAEEEQAGWVLLEKLDDRRVRFKRPLALRDLIKTKPLAFDPYRTEYREPLGWRWLLVAIAFLSALILPAYLGYVLVSQSLTNSSPPSPGSPAGSPPGAPPATPPAAPGAPPESP